MIVQDGHIYFENAASVAQMRNGHAVWREYRLRNTPVLELYHLAARQARETRAASVPRRPDAVVGAS